MSEMLGNQYFLSRNFSKAKVAYEKVLSSEPYNDFVKKRLIICYTQTGEINKAFELFFEIVKKNIDLIINTDLASEDCPCQELISKYGNVKPTEECSYDAKLMLGMLWLFCNSQVSFEFFDNLSSEENSDIRVIEVRNIISETINQSEKHSS